MPAISRRTPSGRWPRRAASCSPVAPANQVARGPSPHRGEPIFDLEVTFARDEHREPLFAAINESAGATKPAERADEGNRRLGGPEFLTDPDDRDRLTFGETPAGDALRTFVDATDFASESVYLVQQRLGEWHTLALVEVVRDPDGGVNVDFC